MAQKRSAERLLARLGKAASARIVLALAAALFLIALAGCGGGSEASSSATSAPTEAQAESQDQGQSAAGKPKSPAKDDEGAEGAGKQGGGGAGNEAGAQGGGGAPHHPIVPQQGREPGITPQQRREATVADISLESPSSRIAASGALQALPATFTCDGKNTSPALRWQGVPQGTQELAIFTMNVQPVQGRLFFDWAVAGIDPGLEEIGAGKLPAGAVLGQNSFGKAAYGICPEGEGETYMFILYALPKKLGAHKGFDPLALRKEVLASSGDAGILALNYVR